MTNQLPETTAWEAHAFSGGWLRLNRRALVEGEFASTSGPPMTVYLRVERNEAGGFEVREAAMTSPGPLDAASWRDVPFSMAALMVTAPTSPAGITADDWMGGTQLSLAELMESEFGPAEKAPAMFIGPQASIGAKLAALRAPARNLTDEFLADLAAAYRELVATKQNPAPAIAEQTGAPVATVRRWIAVARKREFLPPATQGRAG